MHRDRACVATILAPFDPFDGTVQPGSVAAPRALLPAWLTASERSFRLEDGTGLLDRLLMEKAPNEIAVMRRAVALADGVTAVDDEGP